MTTASVLRSMVRNIPALRRATQRYVLGPKRRRDYIRARGAETPLAEQPVDLRSIKHFRRDHFPDSGPLPWLDRPDAEERIQQKLDAGELTEEQAAQCRFWQKNGYLVLERFFSEETMDRTWEALERVLHPDPTVESSDEALYESRYQDLHFRIPEVADILRSEKVIEVLRRLLGVEIVPFQTLFFHNGSEQSAHSDFIHMTTYPIGYLVATWTALEDVHPDSGPLVYYPGSHRLPYYLSREVGIEPDEALENSAVYAEKYEPFIRDIIAKHRLQPLTFTAKKGDLLVWHANLLHGGSARKSREFSRKSVVCHYFSRGAICYHDLTGCLSRPW